MITFGIIVYQLRLTSTATTDQPPTTPPYIIMSGVATTRTNANRSRKDNEPTDSGSATVGCSAAPTENAGNTNNALKSKTPLQAALVSQKLSYASLPKVSHPFLMPIAEKTLRNSPLTTMQKKKRMERSPTRITSQAPQGSSMLC